MPRRLTSALMATVLFVVLAVPAAGNGDIRITINGQPLAVDVPPLL